MDVGGGAGGTVGGVVSPAPNGIAVTDQGGNIYSRASLNYLTPTSPLPIITYDELKFLEAEAYLRKDNTTEAYEAYLAGIEAAMERAQVEEDDITAYLARGTVSVVSILSAVSILAFRRTGIPTLNNPVGPPPNRFPYPQDEVAANPNVPDRTIQNKVWWAE